MRLRKLQVERLRSAALLAEGSCRVVQTSLGQAHVMRESLGPGTYFGERALLSTLQAGSADEPNCGSAATQSLKYAVKHHRQLGIHVSVLTKCFGTALPIDVATIVAGFYAPRGFY